MKEEHEELEDLLAPLRKDKITLPESYEIPEAHDHPDSFTTIREATHGGKKIEIHTTYRILVDGEPLQAHTTVLDDGTVHSHSLPQYSFSSAVDMVRKLIDAFDVELPEDELGESNPHTSGREEK